MAEQSGGKLESRAHGVPRATFPVCKNLTEQEEPSLGLLSRGVSIRTTVATLWKMVFGDQTEKGARTTRRFCSKLYQMMALGAHISPFCCPVALSR